MDFAMPLSSGKKVLELLWMYNGAIQLPETHKWVETFM